MNVYTYDIEVFAYDWLVNFKEKATGKRTKIWNDNLYVKEFIDKDSLYFGFNSKHYDQYILKAIVNGLEADEIKQVNDYIIEGGQGWQCPLMKDFYFHFNNVDLMDDMQMGTSLKSIQGHLGIMVKESSVPFDIDRPLTADERKETELYCDHDVDTTEMLIGIRNDYLKNKIEIGKRAGLDEAQSLSKTNAKLTAALLKAKQVKHTDERDYVYPDNLLREYIPDEVFQYFDRMHNPELSDKEVFSEKLEITVGNCPVTLGYGGIHGAVPHYIWKEENV